MQLSLFCLKSALEKTVPAAVIAGAWFRGQMREDEPSNQDTTQPATLTRFFHDFNNSAVRTKILDKCLQHFRVGWRRCYQFPDLTLRRSQNCLLTPHSPRGMD